MLSAAPTSHTDALLLAHDAEYGKASVVADWHASPKTIGDSYDPVSQANGPLEHISRGGRDGYFVGQVTVISTNPGSLSPNEYAEVVSSYTGSRPANASLVPFVKEVSSDGFTSLYEVTLYAFYYSNNPGQNGHNINGDGSGRTNDPSTSHNLSTIPIQPTESSQHSESLTSAVRLVTTAIAAQPAVGRITTATTLYHDVVDAVHNTSFGSVNAAVKQAVENLFGNKAQVEALFDRIAAELSEAGKFAAAHSHDAPGLLKVDGVSDWPVQKASLAALPLNIKGVQRALEKVMTDLGHLGSAFSTWFTAQHMTEVAAAVTVITVGSGTALYLRRRGGKLGQKRDEEASSSWLFARLNSAPDAT